MRVDRGTIVLVDFPFSGGAGSKIRPALVVQADRNNRRLSSTIIAMITSHVTHAANDPAQFLIDPTSPEGKSSGLIVPSVVRCDHLFTIEQVRMIRSLGRLSASHLPLLDSSLKAALDIA